MKLISLNIEGHTHWERIIPFLQQERADVVCLQEVFSRDLPDLQRGLGMQGVYVPITRVDQENEYGIPLLGEMGVTLLSCLPLKATSTHYYAGSPEELPSFRHPNDMNRMCIFGTVEKDGAVYTIGTTHFTWSAEGKSSSYQQESLNHLLKILQEKREFVLAGDFNAPRGGEIYERLHEHLTDNIPPEIKTTLDPHLHKAARRGGLELVVDYLWSTPRYVVENVRVISGLSDHQAVVGEIGLK